jgi:ABC-type dipeptide/oligopeptide/nickel transport system ATPase component
VAGRYVKLTVKRSTAIERTPRLQQLEGMFDVPPTRARGPAVGRRASDRGPALERRPDRRAFGLRQVDDRPRVISDAYVRGFEWPTTRSVIDGFPTAASIKDVTALLSSVGFSSPPSWTRPFSVLSNGEQFRATLARALIECPELCVFDEFTSVVDRTVGQIGSAAVAKTVRRRGQQSSSP